MCKFQFEDLSPATVAKALHETATLLVTHHTEQVVLETPPVYRVAVFNKAQEDLLLQQVYSACAQRHSAQKSRENEFSARRCAEEIIENLEIIHLEASVYKEDGILPGATLSPNISLHEEQPEVPVGTRGA